MQVPTYTILKYPLQLKLGEVQPLRLPTQAKIVAVGAQQNALCLWAIVDADGPLATRRIVVVGTGHELPQDTVWAYLGRVTIGSFEWHVLDLGE
jgi:hypothetical protein